MLKAKGTQFCNATKPNQTTPVIYHAKFKFDQLESQKESHIVLSLPTFNAFSFSLLCGFHAKTIRRNQET